MNNAIFAVNNTCMIRAHLKDGNTTNVTIIDKETGKVQEESVKTVKYLTAYKSEFYLVWAELISIIGKTLSKPAISVFAYLALNHKIGTTISITRQIRIEIGEEYGISHGTVSNALAELVENTIIYSTHRGIYKMNPRYFFKGSTSDRNTMLKTILELECPNC